MMNRNGTYKWIAKILAGCLILFIGWFGNEVWGKQQITEQMNAQQNVNIRVMQDRFTDMGKTLTRLDNNVINLRQQLKERDSLFQDMAIKVNIMFDSR